MTIYYNMDTKRATCDICQAKEWLEESEEVSFDEWLSNNYFLDDLTEEDYEEARLEYDIEVFEDIACNDYDYIVMAITIDDREVKSYISLG